MPFSGSTFINVAGASSAAAGQTVQSAVWNNIFIDYEAGMTQLNSQYSSLNTNRNLMWMNGGCEVFQRGAGDNAIINVAASAGSPYTADRWYYINGANQASTITATTGLIDESYLAAKVQRNSAQTGTGKVAFCYPIDTAEIYRMRGNKITLSALLKAGNNFSGGTVTIKLLTGTGSLTKAGIDGANFTGLTTPLSITTTIAINTTASVTGTSSAIVPTNVTQAEVQISWTPSGTAGTDDSITIDDVSLEAVTTSYSVWTIMNYDRVPFMTMLEGCKRFYQKTFNYSVAPANQVVVYTGGTPAFNPQTPGIFSVSVTGIGSSPWQWMLPVELRRVITSSDCQIYNPVNNVNNTAWSPSGGGTNKAINSYIALQTKNIIVDFADYGSAHFYAHGTVSADIT